MEKWTHSICDECWEREYPEREPHKLIGVAFQAERCCFCGDITKSAIYTRRDPVTLRCKGNHYQVGDGSLTFADAISRIVVTEPKKTKKEEKTKMAHSKVQHKWPFAEMKVGQSFLIPEAMENARKVYHTAGVIATRSVKRHNMKFVSRKVENGYRFWRVK